MIRIILALLMAICLIPAAHAQAQPTTQTVTNTTCSGATCTSTTYYFVWSFERQQWMLVSATTVIVPFRGQVK